MSGNGERDYAAEALAAGDWVGHAIEYSASQYRAPAPKRYRTIVVDPPWAYEDYPSMPGAAYSQRLSIRKPMPYEQMAVSEIAAIPIREMADRGGCHLWLWTTSRYLRDAFDVVETWGFTFRQIGVWNKTGARTPFPASFAPNHAEFFLFATLGKLPLLGRWPSNVINAPKQYQHSRKPLAFLDCVEQVSPPPYLELFARRIRLGWDAWGDEVGAPPGLPLPEKLRLPR